MADNKGFVKVYRSWLNNPVIWTDADHIAIWMYLIREAVYTEEPGNFKGKPIILKPGQLITGRKVISASTKCNESKIYRVIKKFETAQLIEQQTSNKNSLITILCWDDAAVSEQQNVTIPNRNEMKSNENETELNTFIRKRNREKETEKDLYDYDVGLEPDSQPIATTGAAIKAAMELLELNNNSNNDLAMAVCRWIEHLEKIDRFEYGLNGFLETVRDEESPLYCEGAIKAIDRSINNNSITINWDFSRDNPDDCSFN